MADFKAVKVYFAHDADRIAKNKWVTDYIPYKELTANTPAELEGLLRIGWTLEPPKEAK